MSTLAIALLGAGLFAKEAHLPALVRLKQSVSLVAVYSHSLKSAAALAQSAKEALHLPTPPSVYHDVDSTPSTNLAALLHRPDIHAVIIALPITVQPDIIRQCLAAGKHVLSEKPIAPSVQEGEALIAEYENTYRAQSLVWRVAENFEAEEGYRKVGELVKQGKIGKVAWWNLSSVGALGKDSKWYKTPWRTVPEYQGGFLLDGGVHSTAVLRVTLPAASQPTHLSGYATLTQAHLAPEDTFNVVASSAHDGTHGVFELSQGAPSASRATNSYKVTGRDGWIDVSRGDQGVFIVTLRQVRRDKKGDVIVGGEEKTKWVFESDGVKREVEAFVGAVLRVLKGDAGVPGPGPEGLGDPRGALKDVAFIEAGLKSHGEKLAL